MNPRRRITWLAVAVLLFAGGLGTGTQQGRAASQAATRTAVALSVGVSEATGHVFIVSTYLSQPVTPYTGPQQSWVSMLDAHSYKVLRVIPVAAGATQVLVNDRTGRAFVVHAFGPRYPTSVTVLDTRTANVLRRTPCGQGLLTDVMLASQVSRLLLATSRTGSMAAPFTLHVLDAATGKPVRQVTLPRYVSAGAIDERSGRLFLASASAITVYDIRSFRAVRTIPITGGTPLVVPDEVYHRVLVVSALEGKSAANKEMNILNVFGVSTGKRISTTRIGTTRLAALAFDQASDHLFALSDGTYTAQSRPESDGILRILAWKTYRNLRAMRVGVVFTARPSMLVDPRTHHLFVLSYGHLQGPGKWTSTSIVSMFDTRTGSLLAQTKIPVTSKGTMVLDGKAGRVYVNLTGLNSGTGTTNAVAVLSATTGAMLRSVALPSTPSG
jgi:hypothetical protein